MDESLGITLQQPPTLVALSCSPLQQVKTGKIQIGERTRQKVFSNQLFIIIGDIALEQIETDNFFFFKTNSLFIYYYCSSATGENKR